MDEEQSYPEWLMQEEQEAYEQLLEAENRLQAQIAVEENQSIEEFILPTDFDELVLDENGLNDTIEGAELTLAVEQETEEGSYRNLVEKLNHAYDQLALSEVIVARALDILLKVDKEHHSYRKEVKSLSDKLSAHPVMHAYDAILEERRQKELAQERAVWKSVEPKKAQLGFFKPQPVTKQQAFQTMCEVLGQDSDISPFQNR